MPDENNNVNNAAASVVGATGRRKVAMAAVRLTGGSGRITVNGRDFKEYFPLQSLRNFILQPLQLTNMSERFDVAARVRGGGIVGQAGALRHGLARALLMVDASLRTVLKNSGFLTRDSRLKERKKPGRPGARKRFQFSKR
ncbi:MAG: 30S ribosomal protein S9 [Kiritimatiellae bacterium]|jgi:small subunit ribosomal protein S9|nr:30S ribosomal protein S9 [Kiritimatiellia bacterium]